MAGLGPEEGGGGKADTWPKLLAENYGRFGDRRKAMRHKRYGIWQPYTWKDYYLDVRHLALGLLSLGFKAGDKLLILGDNAPQWYCAELAAQANHGAAVGVYPDLTARELRVLAGKADVRFAVVQDQEQVDKLLDVKESLPLLERIVFWNYKGLAHYREPLLAGWREILDLGRQHEKENPGLFEKNVESGSADDVCAIVYTGGTSGSEPKLAVHSYRTMREGSERYRRLDPWQETDEVIPHLPPAGITGQWTGIGCHLLSGCILNFAEAPETQVRDEKEVGPNVVVHAAKVWESAAARMQARILTAGGLKRAFFRVFMPVGYRIADSAFGRAEPAVGRGALYRLAHTLLFLPMKRKLGLARARICYSTGALLSPEALRFYRALDVPLKSVYGTTEGGVLGEVRPQGFDAKRVGLVLDGAEARLTADEEIAYRQPGLFLGYYKDPAATAAVLEDGWFRSGDCGSLENGNVVFLDRIRSMVRLPGGGKLALQWLESRLRSSPYIKDAWVFLGPGGGHPSAAVVINYGAVSRWAGQRRIPFHTFLELSQRPEVYELVGREIERLNADLPPDNRVEKYVNLHKEFDPDEGELTRTRNLRRGVLVERYRELIEAVCAGRSEARLESGETGGPDARQVALTIASVGAAR
ncbi:MAG: AMP-binding protein [Deltaproteobacteria bacterium]|nr:AMP-binding protein [Deltaproteobacteria bacterium]